MRARKEKITKNNFGCYTNAEQQCIAFLKDLGKLIQAHYTQHSGGLCSNESSNFSILSSRKKSVIIFTIPFFFSHLYNLDPCLILPKVLPRLPLITLWVPQRWRNASLREAWLHFLSSSSCLLLKHFPDLTLCSSQKTTKFKNSGFFHSQQNLYIFSPFFMLPRKTEGQYVAFNTSLL